MGAKSQINYSEARPLFFEEYVMARLNGLDPNDSGNDDLHCSDMIFYQLAIFAAFYISLIAIILWMYCKHLKEKKA